MRLSLMWVRVQQKRESPALCCRRAFLSDRAGRMCGLWHHAMFYFERAPGWRENPAIRSASLIFFPME
jgi:hypothetical protein